MDRPKFIFTNTPDLPSVQSANERRSLRSQMMTQFLREQRVQRMKPPKDSHPKILQSEVGTALICRCEPGAQDPSSSPPNLISILGSGRVDPFVNHSIAREYPEFHQLMDYCVNILWPGFRVHNGYPNEFYRAWVHPLGESPLISYTTLYLVSVHLDALALTKGAVNHPLHTTRQLRYRDKALKLLQQVLRHPERGFNLDDTVGAILDLAANETRPLIDTLPKDPTPFTSPLEDKQWLSYFGARKYHPAHWTAACALIEQHGGVQSLKRFGLTWLISLSGVMAAAQSRTKPPFPMIEPNGQPYHYLPPLEYLNIDEVPWQKIPEKQGFQQLRYLGIMRGIVRVFNDLGELSQAIEAWTQQRYKLLHIDILCDIRNLVQHRLLSLPTRSDPLVMILDDAAVTIETTLLALNLYQMCRLAAELYSIHVTFPIPRSLALRKSMRSELLGSIQTFNVEVVSPGITTVVLWCTVIGGIAADKGPERPAYAAEVDRLSSLLGVTSWKEVQLLLRSCAWLDTACNTGGNALGRRRYRRRMTWTTDCDRQSNLWNEVLEEDYIPPALAAGENAAGILKTNYSVTERRGSCDSTEYHPPDAMVAQWAN